ncbi:MAG: BadF/BadG/BcrA/BcrD ATPase family protein, partial [Leptolinea sp.]
ALSVGVTSLVVGKNMEGTLVKVGGWGALLGERGSSYAIGMLAVQHLTRAVDGRADPTLIVDGVMRRWNLAKPRDLYRKVYLENISPQDYVDLVEVVLETAQMGDMAAQAILHQTAVDLAGLTATVATRLGLPVRFPCFLHGSILLENSPIYQDYLEETLKQGLILDPIIEVKEPALGAVRLAIAALKE